MSGVFRVFRSTDAGAPALSGTAGALVAVLDAVLVDGYGVGPSAKSPAGWTREYMATNKRVYRNATVGGSGYRLRVDDTAAVGNARHAFLRGYRTMSDIDTGTDAFPTVAQLTNGSLWQKSTLADATARAWTIFANDKTAYLFFDCSGAGIAAAAPFGFGDLLSHKAVDLDNFFISGNGLTSYVGAGGDPHGTLYRGSGISNGMSAVGPGIASNGYLARSFDSATVSPIITNIENDCYAAASSVFGRGPIPYPDPVSGGVLLGPAHVKEAINRIRGKLSGILVPQHSLPFADHAVLTGLAGLGGITAVAKTFRSNQLSSTAYEGQVLIDVTTDY